MGGGRANSRFIYTGLLEYFIVQLKLAMFGAAFLSFPVVASQLYMFVAPGLYRNEKQAFLPYLVATPFLFFLGAAWSISWCGRCCSRFSSRCSRPVSRRCRHRAAAKVEDYLS